MKTDLSAHIAEIARRILGPENKELSTRSELRFGTRGSVTVMIAGKDRGKWYDHEHETGGGAFQFIEIKGNVARGDVLPWLRDELGIEIENAEPRRRRLVTSYIYRDESGAPLARKNRWHPKWFSWERANGTGGWSGGRGCMKGVRRVLYRLPEVKAAPADVPIFVVEGEKDADNGAAIGLVTTCNPDGGSKTLSGKPGKWRPEFSDTLRGRCVAIIPDNDDVGRAHANTVANALAQVECEVRIVPLPVAEAGGDLSDWLDGGGTIEQLHAIVAEAKPFSAEPPQKAPRADDDEIERLAKLPQLQYERERPAAAERLGCRASILDRLVAIARGNGNGNGAGQGRPIELRECEPWPDPVNGNQLLNELSASIRRHVVLAEQQADAVALWVLAVHAFDAFAIFPRLLLTAAEKGSGKSTALRVVSCLVPKPLSASNATASTLFRVIEMARPTLLLDEADVYARDNEDLRSVLDAGHERGGSVLRNVGENHEPRSFSVWAPVVLAGIGHLPGTVEDRSVIIKLKRRRPDEPIEPLRIDKPNGLDRLARMATRWAKDHASVLTEADPEMPPGIINRVADNWRPLIAVADLAGGNWPARARDTASSLVEAGEDESHGVQLLTDIRAAFESEGADRLAGEDVVTYLLSLDDRPWPEFKKGKPISKAQVARIVKRYGVSSGTIRLDDDRTAKGYYRHAFDDAFARYLPSQNVTPSQPAENLGSQANFKTSQGNGCDVFESARTPSNSAGCDGVTFSEPLFWANDVIEAEERAAILEYDGGMSREEAERAAGL